MHDCITAEFGQYTAVKSQDWSSCFVLIKSSLYCSGFSIQQFQDDRPLASASCAANDQLCQHSRYRACEWGRSQTWVLTSCSWPYHIWSEVLTTDMLMLSTYIQAYIVYAVVTDSKLASVPRFRTPASGLSSVCMTCFNLSLSSFLWVGHEALICDVITYEPYEIHSAICAHDFAVTPLWWMHLLSLL